ncbi:MAG TPA: amidohydrolase family protein [Actinokineospora sp.]|jgi:cytosine/adenosine deaminase-related metal-dependent hydrolase|nr:amidohydrolase family protein [Actinokineospora sp.]
MNRTVLRNGLVIDTEPAVVAHQNTDVLIEDGRIAAVGPNLPAADATVIDATDRIVLPGFVDTHRHLWQTTLRGIAADADLGEYLSVVLGKIAGRYRPQDVYAGTLAGAWEALACGVTTVQDFSHISASPAHADAAVTALRESGIRAVYGHGRPVFGEDIHDLRRVHRDHFAGDSDLVRLASAPSGPSYQPIDEVAADLATARDLGVRTYVHVGRGPMADRPIALLRSRGLLHADITFVHANSLPDDELALIAEAGAAVAIAPAVEAQMGHGAPMACRLRANGITTGLGVDVVTTVAGDMFSVMRAAILTSRTTGDHLTAAEALTLATISGAATLGMADEVGSLRVGKKADLIILRANDVNLLGGAHDPVGTVVTAAHPGNIDLILINGRVVPAPPTSLATLVRDSAAYVTK